MKTLRVYCHSQDEKIIDDALWRYGYRDYVVRGSTQHDRDTVDVFYKTASDVFSMLPVRCCTGALEKRLITHIERMMY